MEGRERDSFEDAFFVCLFDLPWHLVVNVDDEPQGERQQRRPELDRVVKKSVSHFVARCLVCCSAFLLLFFFFPFPFLFVLFVLFWLRLFLTSEKVKNDFFLLCHTF